MGRLAGIFVTFLVFNLSLALAARPQASKSTRTVHAHRSSERIILDGILDEKTWSQAVPETEFTQRDPDEGKTATERTELRVVYDNTAIYFGVRMRDSEPQRIVRQLSRRDDYADADSLTIQLSPHHDSLTGAIFEISAAGVQRDAIVSNDVFTDYSWEGIWESSVRIDDEGWSAELRIPFSQLRYPEGVHQLWRINASRFIHRKHETVWLHLVPKNENGLASRMDDLEGIEGIEARKHLDLMPYIAGRAAFVDPGSVGNPFNDGSRISASSGIDIKYGISSNITLDATFNPDFGQVEVDPAVVNLSAFETFFEERRPFFIEGAQIFNSFGSNGANNFMGFNREEPNLFYTRRIGRAPEGFAQGDFVDSPSATTILGAAKLSGKTSSGWSLGLVEALAGSESAKVATNGQRTNIEVEPRTNYFVARLLREKNRAGYGLITTSVHRDFRESSLRDLLTSHAYVVGGDGYLFLDSGRNWVVNGKISSSSVAGSEAALDRLQRAPQHYFQRPDARQVRLRPGATSMKGWTGSVNLNRNQGDRTVNVALWGVSPGFEANDLGFQTGADIGGAHAAFNWKKPNPDRLTRDRSLTVAKSWTWNFARQRQHDGFFAFGNMTMHNYWSFGGSLGVFRTVHDDRLTRGGPAALNPASRFVDFSMDTDSRKRVSVHTGYNYSSNEAGDWGLSGNVGVSVKPTSSLFISSGPEFNRSRGTAQYVTSIQDSTASATLGGRYLFADFDQSQVSLTTRVNWILSPKMSLQIYMQPLISVGDYWDFKEFARPRTYSFLRYGRDIGEITPESPQQFRVDPDGPGPAQPFNFSDPDFNFKSLRLNAVFRWEWKLGSTLYFVWTENRQDFSNSGQFSPRRDVGRLFTARPDDIFLVRLAYWFSK